jgi:hypothetical protein
MTKATITAESKKATAIYLRSWMQEHHFAKFTHSLAATLCDQALEQIIKHDGNGVIHPSVILALATASEFTQDAQSLAFKCLDSGLVELTQHGGKGSDVRKAVADTSQHKAGVSNVLAWLEDNHGRSPNFKHQLPATMCHRALQEIERNGYRGLIHPSILFAMDNQRLFTTEYAQLIGHCVKEGLVQVTRTEQQRTAARGGQLE